MRIHLFTHLYNNAFIQMRADLLKYYSKHPRFINHTYQEIKYSKENLNWFLRKQFMLSLKKIYIRNILNLEMETNLDLSTKVKIARTFC